MKVLRDKLVDGNVITEEVFDIVECTYSGKYMGERSITATVNWASPIDFQVGDYIDLQMQSLVRGGGMHGDTGHFERFYIYTMPTVKKTARPMTHGKGFEHTVTFYPAQYELGCVQMRDLGNSLSTSNIIYTGFDTVSFYGGAKELMERIMLVLKEAYHDADGNPLWNYHISPLIDEEKNTALERFPLSFSGNTVMDALLKLSDKEGINTTFFVNNRTIYVGYKRPYFCRVTDGLSIDTNPSSQTFFFEYGKTSHEDIAINHGGLFDITKTLGNEIPITKLFAYGASRNLNRYYCSDRLTTGRFVNRVMLPSFSNDGKTDFILSEEGIKRFGIREGSKQFDDVYPSVRYVTYGDIRKIKYCIKIETNGITNDDLNNSSYPIARVQCYAVLPCTGKDGDGTKGVNKLVYAVPPEDLAIYVHAVDKIVKVVLCGGKNGMSRQADKDLRVPTYDGTEQIPGSCFLVHDPGFKDQHNGGHLLDRDEWFLSEIETKEKYNDDTEDSQDKINEIDVHRINYKDTYWLTDLYVFTDYGQVSFDREGYSAWAYPKLNSEYVIKDENGNGVSVAQDSLLVNEIVEVEPITVEDTSAIIAGVGVDNRQKTFDIFLRDVGFKIDEQNAFGEKVFVFNTLKFSILDGNLAGQEFEVSGPSVDNQSAIICAYNNDGSFNDDFFYINGKYSQDLARKALNKGAIWRVRLNRTNLDEPDYSNLNIALPTNEIHAKEGDHFVLLDLYMPDIYIKAAEDRLLREARKYLDANDNGSVSYSVSLDKVRMQQIPQYALQVREGLNIRMRDYDLDITTLNRTRTIFNGELLSRASTYETTYSKSPATRVYYTSEHRDYIYFKKYYEENNADKKWFYDEKEGLLSPNVVGVNNWCLVKKAKSSTENGSIEFNIYLTDHDKSNGEVYFRNNEVTLRILERVKHQNGTFYKPTKQYLKLSILSYEKKNNLTNIVEVVCKSPVDFELEYTFKNGSDEYFAAMPEYDMRYRQIYEGYDYVPNYNIMNIGANLYCHSRALIEFSQMKHYEIIIEAGSLNLLRLTNGKPHFALLNNLSQESLYYIPDYSVVEEETSTSKWRRFKFSFDLGCEFNDTQDYYPALQYTSDNVAEYVETKLISVVESDTKDTKDLPYADFTLDSVTIKITDSSQRQEGAQPIKDISATLSEQHNASTWATLMSRVEQTELEGERNAKTAETLANTARRYNQALLNLKNHIFDPDGNCTQTFLQTMMTQVGADSMNYQLDKTRISFGDGEAQKYNNFNLYADENGVYHFNVGTNDVLRHFTHDYMSGSTAGTWQVEGNTDTILDGISVYFVAIKCPIDGTGNATWVCEPVQHKVNELAGYWYFNWGVIIPDSTGVYDIIETRGNAYMYGDNIVAGKISSLAQNSWFDLTRGEFVLGQGKDSAALSFKDGKLTIAGLVTKDTVNQLMNEYMSNVQICGENICPTPAIQYEYFKDSIIGLTQLMSLDAGQKYIASYTKFENNATPAEEWAMGVCLVVAQTNAVESIESVHYFGDVIEVNGNGRQLYIAWGVRDYVDIVKGTTPSDTTTQSFTQYLDGVMVQKGDVATAYQEYIQYLTSSLQSTTDITGGLVMTDILMLRNEYGSVTAGMSGRDDSDILLWGGATHSQAKYASEHDYDKGDDTGNITSLLKRDGTGKLGCFRLLSKYSAAIYDAEDKDRILFDVGVEDISMKIQTKDDDGNLTDNVVVCNEAIDVNFEHIEWYGGDSKLVKSEESAYTDCYYSNIFSLRGDGWHASINSAHHFAFAMHFNCGSLVHGLKIGAFGDRCTLSLEKLIGIDNYEQIAEISISDIYADVDYKNDYVYFKLPVLELIPQEMSGGTYRFKVNIPSFVRTNSAGNYYSFSPSDHLNYPTMSRRIESGKIFFYLNDSIVFTKASDVDNAIVKLGHDGIKISSSSSSRFVVKNSDPRRIRVFMNGLPIDDSELEVGELWNDGGVLKIKQ